nr:MAG TPA: hypothetical protein [Bacteriophage sp.]
MSFHIFESISTSLIVPIIHSFGLYRLFAIENLAPLTFDTQLIV